jgi:MYXO-CTERM domain-containing protein
MCVNDNCAHVSCPSGRECDPSTNPGTCVMNMCSGVTCSMGLTCNPVTGSCVGDPCLGLHCPAMTECRAGECQATMPANHDAGPMADTGTGMDAGAGVDSGLQRVLAAGGGGCLCNVGEGTRGSSGATLVLLALGGVLVARRRRAGRGGAR